jgi:uncharacterized membrane protein
MMLLILGLLIFFATHSLRIFAEGWRAARIARMGERAWKGVYALLSLLGFALMVWGYSETRGAPELWHPPLWTRHLAGLLTLPAFVLLVAAYVPRTRIKAAIGHPMVMGVMLWALAHVMSNGRAGDLLLFGAFLVWAFVDYLAARRRDRLSGTLYVTGPLARDAAALVIGVTAWALFAKWGHAWLIGVAPFV